MHSLMASFSPRLEAVGLRKKSSKVVLSSTLSFGKSRRSPYCASSASSSCIDGATEHKLAVSRTYNKIMSKSVVKVKKM